MPLLLRSISPVYLIHFNLICYSLFWWSVQPVFPYLSSQLGASPLEIGYLSSASSLFQLFGSPFMGRLMDTRGPKLALLLSHFFAALSYLLLSLSTSIPLLYLSQLPTFFLASMHASQAYLTQVSTSERRAEALGSLSLSYGVGMVLGPTLGGALSAHMSYESTAALASAASFLVMLVIAFTLPSVRATPADDTTRVPLLPAVKADAVPVAEAVKASEKAEVAAGGGLSALRSLLYNPLLRQLLLIKLLASFGVSVYRAAFTLLAKDAYGVTAQQNGWIMSTVGLLGVFTNTVVVSFVNRRFLPSTVISASLLAISASFLPLPFSLTLSSLLVSMVPITIATTTAATLLTSTLTTASPKEQAGQVIGFDQSVGTLSRVVAPVVAGLLLQGGQREVGMVCGVLVAVAYGISRWTDWGPGDAKARKEGVEAKVRVE